MSTNTQVAILAPLGTDAGRGRGATRGGDRPLVRLTAFGALGLYGVIRWGTLMHPAPTGRLIGLLALALVLAGLGPVLLERERAVAASAGRDQAASLVSGPLAVLAVLLALPIAGVPLAWVIHLRVAVTADGIGQGLSALPGILLPYDGINEWARTVMVLGAAILLLDAAMLLAFAPAALGDLRRAGAALPLLALVVVPSTLVHPKLAYLQGLVLFALLAFFMWGERVAPDRRGAVIVACAATGALGMIIAPALNQPSAWVNYEALTSGFTPAHVERFDWTQRYGPLNWPRTGNTVLQVKASPAVWSGEYWKTENLDTFDGRGWVSGVDSANAGLPGVSGSTIARFTQSLTVTINAMNTNDVIAAGFAQPPVHLSSAPTPGSSAGTWTSTNSLGPGDSYTVKVYVPHPPGRQLARAGRQYPAQVARAGLQVTLPQTSDRVPDQTVQFGPWGSQRGPQNVSDPRTSAEAAIGRSPYRQIYPIAQRLGRGARTPYAYVQRVMGFLDSGSFSYDEYPPPTQFPLVSFLLSDKFGYCQQFAGAMALLLRMGGVPARVATGFTTGNYDAATKHWLVSDIDAHAWVEAWFPGYGWVSFDPTPPAAPARGGKAPIGSLAGLGGTGATGNPIRRPEAPGTGPSGGTGVHHAGSSGGTFLLTALGVLLALLALGLLVWRRRPALDADGMLAELERALARSGRPIADGVTLAALERRFRTSPEAAAYVRALRMTRFGGQGALPTLSQRRALRAQLRAGLGLGGAARALWALPPRPQRHRGPPERAV